MKSAVVLSPHLDDAVFSCWHALSQPNTQVITVFAGKPTKDSTTLWNRLCGEASAFKMTELRLQENKAVLDGLGITFHNLSYLDRQYRPGGRDIPAIAETILKKVGKDVVFFAPLAGGALWRHPDHVTVRRVGEYLAAQGYGVSFYADIPYMQMPFYTPADYERHMAWRAQRILGYPVRAEIVAMDDGVRKRQAMRQYRTQYSMANLVSCGTLGRRANVRYEAVFVGLT